MAPRACIPLQPASRCHEPTLPMLRSLLFTLVFYVNTVVFLVFGSPLLFGPRSWAMAGLEAHARTSLWWLEAIVGTRLEVRGRERLPAGPILVAAKHQSAWDAFALIPLFDDPALMLKAELLAIPFYGWFCRKFAHIAVKRQAGPAALRRMVHDAKTQAERGRQILIFPEGTRRTPGAPPDYKPGVLTLYESLALPCVPVALSTPDCSGRAAASCAGPEPPSSRSSIRSRREWSAPRSALCWKPASRPPVIACWRKLRPPTRRRLYRRLQPSVSLFRTKIEYKENISLTVVRADVKFPTATQVTRSRPPASL